MTNSFDQTKLKGGDIPLTRAQNLLLCWTLGIPFLHETSSSAWPLLSSFPSYKFRNWQNFEAMTWRRETGEIPFSRQKAKRTITGWYFFKWQESKSQRLPFEFCYGDRSCACTSQTRDFGHQKHLLWLLWVKMSAGAFCSKNYPGTSLLEPDSQKHVNNINCTSMLAKALGLVFAWCVPTSTVVWCGENPMTHIRFPIKNLAQTRRPGEFVLSSPGKCICILDQQLAVYVSMDLYLWK